MSLKVVTLTVWLGWSHCMDSDFVVTSGSRSSPPQTTSVSCRPLQVHLWPPSWSFFYSAWVAAGSPPWLPSSAPPHTVEPKSDIAQHSFSSWEPSTSQGGHLLASSGCRPYLGGRPKFQLTKTRDAMGFCTLILQLYYIVLLFQQFFDVVSTVST